MTQPREYSFAHCDVCRERIFTGDSKSRCTVCGDLFCDGCNFECSRCHDSFCLRHIVPTPVEAFSEYRCQACEIAHTEEQMDSMLTRDGNEILRRAYLHVTETELRKAATFRQTLDTILGLEIRRAA